MNIYHLFNRANRTLDAQENRLNEIQQQFNNMSTIHTAMTGKTDSLIDAVRESEINKPKDGVCRGWAMMENESPKLVDAGCRGWLMMYQPPVGCVPDSTHPDHPDHPDYMRMVVHQMD